MSGHPPGGWEPGEYDRERCHCGWVGLRRVEVERPDGSKYRTEFGACEHCGAMFHKPLAFRPSNYAYKVFEPPAPREGPSEAGFPTYAPMPPAGPRKDTTEEREVREAAERASKSKGKRRWR